MSDKCPICNIDAKLFCSACKSVKYCSADHQKKDWKNHKLICRPFCIKNDPELGRYLQATRDIKAKNIIFTEMPLVIGPKWYLNETEELIPIVPCVGCFQPTQVGHNSCPRCHWPACQSTCTGLDKPKLHGDECSILALSSGPKKFADLKILMDYYRTDALIVLKCLLLQCKSSKKWELLLDMQSHETERLGSELFQDAEKRIVSYLQNNFLRRLESIQNQTSKKFLNKFDSEMLHKICGIIETNYMCISLLNGLELSGIFYTACMMEHSCIPNCYFTFDNTNGFKISIIAGRDIKKNEHLKIMYSNILWGTEQRQTHLQMTKHFYCKCLRCADPTELGTYLSALKCIGIDEITENNGIQLPENPLLENSEWCCNKCPIRADGKEIRYLLSQMNEEVDQLLASKPTIIELENLIEKLSKFLHDNHFLLFNLKHSLIQLYGKQNGYLYSDLTDSQLNYKLSLCNNLLNICDKLDPHTIRLSIYVGVILYEMHSVIVEEFKRKTITETDDENIKKKLKENLNLAHDYLLRAADVLKKELDNIGGSKLSDAVIKSITNLNNLISNSSL